MLLINKTLLHMSKGIRVWIILIAALRMVSLIGTAIFARAMSGFLGNLLQPNLSADEITEVLWMAFVSALIILVGELLTGEVEVICTNRFRISLRKQIFSKILLLDVGRVDKIGATNSVAAATDGVEAMQLYYSRYLPGLIFCVVAPIYLYFRIRVASESAALFLLITALALLPANTIFRKITNQLKNSYWGSFRDLTAYYLESVRSLVTLKLFNRDGQRSEVLHVKAKHFNEIVMSVLKVNFNALLFSDTIVYLSVFGGLLIVCHQLIAGTITLDGALMVLMLGYAIFSSFRQLMNTAHMAMAGVSAAQNVAEILEIDTTRPYNPEISDTKFNDFDGIRFEDVTFAYTGRNAVLNKASLDIPKGKVTALVGRSGSGKSTIGSLLMRFFDPQNGRIFVEGYDYIGFTPDTLREKIVMVPQYVNIFTGTIADNLRFARPNATDDEMMDALDMVRLGDWVRSQPKGLLTDVGDAGAKLSGGQRQKIGIARVLLYDSPYIIFDEATSSVDSESEQEIWACIADLAKIKTLVIISHRLSTVRQADVIYVLDDGQISAGGFHEELMGLSELYRELVNEQEALENSGGEKVIV